MVWLFCRTSHLPSRRRQRITGIFLTLAQLAYAHWFFGNLYEVVVRIPHRLVNDRVTSPLGPGSPVRYYLPGVPITIVATLAAVLTGWNETSNRRWLVAAATCSISGGVATAYLVRTVNRKLFFANQPLTPAEQEKLLRTWYRLNGFRLIAIAAAWVAARLAMPCPD